MVNCCAVFGCPTRGGDSETRLYRFPAIKGLCQEIRKLQTERRKAWFHFLRRKDLNIDGIVTRRICSKHFLTGKPADIKDTSNPDWVPSVTVAADGSISNEVAKKMNRFIRCQNRSEAKMSRSNVKLQKKQVDASNKSLLTQTAQNEEEFQSIQSTQIENNIVAKIDQVNQSFEVSLELNTSMENGLSEDNTCSQGTQTDKMTIHGIEFDSILAELQARTNESYALTEKVKALQREIELLSLDESGFINDDSKVTFFTGLSNYKLMKVILKELEPTLNAIKVRGIDNFRKLLMTLMKLRMNLTYRALSYRFNINLLKVRKIFVGVIAALNGTFFPLIYWPDRDSLRLLTPQCFEERFGSKVAVIIDCFEIPTQRPSTLRARNQTFSNYKQRHTAKYLIGITPQGTISFISLGYGGRVSDKFITEDCGILDKLLPGDIVLADRGFTVNEIVGMRQAELKTPAFKNLRNQLRAKEVEETREIAAVRVHVERVIGCVRQKFKILNGPVTINMLRQKSGDESLLDRVVRVCCALNNLCNSVIPL